MIPALFGVSVNKSTCSVDTFIASFLATEALLVSCTTQIDCLNSHRLFGIAIATVILPAVS